MQQAAGTRVITSQDWGRDLGIVLGTGSCTPLIWPGVGARHRSMHLLVLGPAYLRHGLSALLVWRTAEESSPYSIVVKIGNEVSSNAVADCACHDADAG